MPGRESEDLTAAAEDVSFFLTSLLHQREQRSPSFPIPLRRGWIWCESCNITFNIHLDASSVIDSGFICCVLASHRLGNPTMVDQPQLDGFKGQHSQVSEGSDGLVPYWEIVPKVLLSKFKGVEVPSSSSSTFSSQLFMQRSLQRVLVLPPRGVWASAHRNAEVPWCGPFMACRCLPWSAHFTTNRRTEIYMKCWNDATKPPFLL